MTAIKTAYADIRWQSRTVERDAKIGEDTVTFSFVFTNPEIHSITVRDVKPSCGCTTIDLDRKTFGPGERGIIEARMNVRGLSGLQEKTIDVFTSESAQPTTLTIRVNIPSWLEISPRLLIWSIGEANRPKDAHIKINAATDLKLSLRHDESRAMEVSLERGLDGRSYRLIAKPWTTQEPTQLAVNVIAETSDSDRRSFVVFAQVR